MMIKQCSSLIFFIALLSSVGYSQESRKDKSYNHDRIKAQKIAYITDALELTPSESEKFWPLYNEFKKAHDVLHDWKHSNDKIGDISESEARALLSKSIEQDKKEIELKEKYHAKFLEVISAQKLVRLRGVERKFRKDILYALKDRYRSKKS